MSEWIIDRKPEKYGEYLVTLPDGDSRYVSIETFHPEDGWDSLYRVLAWQELPKPYEGEIKEECIPVSWISKWLEKQMDSFKNTTSQYNIKEFVRMILDWEKEKETSARPTVSLISGSVKFSNNVTTQINNDIGHGVVTAISSVKPDPNLKLVGNKEEKENEIDRCR